MASKKTKSKRRRCSKCGKVGHNVRSHEPGGLFSK